MPGGCRSHERRSLTDSSLLLCECQSLGRPGVCSRIVSIAEVDRPHVALTQAANSRVAFGPSAYLVCANACWKLRWRGEAAVGVAVPVSKPAVMVGRRPGDLPMEGAPGSQPRGVGAPREDGSSVLQMRLVSHGSSCSTTWGVSSSSVWLVCRRTSGRGSFVRFGGRPLAGRPIGL